MLQRAASNAYSWWYASHVRTKQSKWLEQSLQDMGEKVENVLQLIQEDGDSFAKRAEMYYKKRPELINFVEESYRAYRSLAERYDHISRELQNANNTLASAFPDQYQFMMDDDDEYNNALGVRKKFQDRPSNNPNIPQTPPKFPSKNIKAIIALTTNSKKSHPKTGPKSGAHANKVAKSGLTLSEATTEIDKLQKQILTLQTEKEFAKSSYESGYANYCDIDEQITGTQEKISKLQDEFEVAQVIEDDEARTLMAEAAIKSCNDTLSQLQEKQEKASEETKAESHKIKNVRDKLNSFKGEFRRQKSNASEDQISSVAEGAGGSGKSEDLELLQDKIKEHFDVGETKSLSVLEMAEKIDELVNKVINLESSMSFQTSLIHSLRSETDELQSQVKSLEDDKANLIAGKSTLNDKLEEMENKLKGLQDLNDSLENQNTSLETHFNEAQSNLEIITTKWLDVKQEEVEFEDQIESKENKESIGNMDVKVRIPQNEQVNDMITSSLSQDGEKVQKTILPMSIEEPPIPSKTNNIQQHESKLGIIDNNHQQETSNKKDEEMMNPQPMHKQQPATHVSTPPEVDVKFGIVQDEQVSDMIAPSRAQDEGDIVHKIILPMSTYEPTIPSKINSIQQQQSKQSTEDSNQLQETSNKKEGKVTNPQKTHKQQHATQASFTLEVESRELINMSLAKSNAPLSMQEPEEKRKEEPDWQELFTDCLEGKEKVLLEEYTTTLRNYKETKKKLYEVETKNKENFSEIEKQIKELKISLATKDEEIHSLHQQLIFVHKKLEEHENGKEKDVEYAVTYEGPSFSLEEDDDIKVMVLGDGQEISPVEYKLRAKMDQILDENLDFWMRFSASFGQVQKFQNGVQDLQAELGKLEKKEGSSHEDTHMNLSLKSDVRPIYKHLIEIQTELTVWLEQSEKLKEELQRRFSQLCHIQEEIKHAVNAGAEDDDMKFTSFQAAKFQGEVANMQQENNKVADELQAGMDYINSLQLEVECTTTRLNEELGFYHSKSQNERSGNRARVPLRSFIFGVKSQKKKQSIFSRMHPGMTNRKYHQLKGDKSP